MWFRITHRAYRIASIATIISLALSQAAPLAALASSPPDAPTNLAATPGDSSAALSWSAPDNTGSSSINGYKIEDSLHDAPLNFTKLFDAGVITTNNGSNPPGNALLVGGKLYGVTQSGGANEQGTIFSFDPSGNTFTVLHDFSTSFDDNLDPSGSLIEADGIFYGMTQRGGTNDLGSIFSYNPVGNVFTVLYSFSSATGDSPYGTLVDVGGLLYGTTETDGAHDSGTIFSYNLSNSTYTDLHDMNSATDGQAPQGALIDVGGILYGTAQAGGVHQGGTMFTFDPSGNTFTDIHDFDGNGEGTVPGAYLLNVDGVLYGTITSGGDNDGGSIFSYDTSNDTLTSLYSFTPDTDGSDPEGGLIDISGVLYGTTNRGGVNGSGGTVYSFNLTGNVFTDLHDFDNDDSATVGSMQGGVVNVAGTLYGMTTGDPFFSIDPSGSDYTVVHVFGNPITSGADPGKLLLPYQGLLYGEMAAGGTHDDGTIFSFDPSDNTYHDLYDLTDADGDTPVGGLINVSGIFYGMTSGDGANGDGTIFSFDPSNNTFTNLHDLDPDVEGGGPTGQLLNVDGLLYGMTNGGGANNGGTIFSFDPSGDTVAVLHNLGTCAEGDDGCPGGSLINVGGILYGLLIADGSVDDGGRLFSFDPSGGGTFTILHSLDFNTDGANPQDNLLNVGGILYGMTAEGGANNYGTIFSFDPSDDTFTKLHDFDSSTEGDGPYSSFVELNGLLYSSTGEGGSGDVGTIFSFDPSDNSVTILRTLSRIADGAFPEGTFVNVNGTLYGTLGEGGAHDDSGTIFSLSKNWTATQQNGTATTGTVSGLTNGTEYDFRVSATNSDGTGDPSDSVTATPVASDDGGDDTSTTTATVSTHGISGGQSASTPAIRANTIANLQAQLNALLAQLAALQGVTPPTGTPSTSVTYARDLDIGATGTDVTSLQDFLLAKDFSIPAGATGYFGPQTQAALAAYQKANGIAPAAGYFGPLTKAYLASH